jgi:sortase A
MQDLRSGRRGARLLRGVQHLFVIAGAAMLVWCAVIVADAILAQHAARQSLEIVPETAAPVMPDSQVEPEDVVPVATARTRALTAVTGSAIGAISIPRLALSAVVLHGSDAQTLRRGPGHVENSSLPGETGNVVIAGHRDSFFRPLRHVRVGDDIFVNTRQGRFHYRVTTVLVVDPQNISVLEPTVEATLTLITCYPFSVLGPAPDRFIVRATRVGETGHGAILIGAPLTLEPMVAPAIQTPLDETVPPRPIPIRTASAPADDETVVRSVIERFRLTYNARLIRNREVDREEPLTFQTCDVAVTGDQAAATCHAESRVSDAGGPAVWTAALLRADGEWAIKSITVQ